MPENASLNVKIMSEVDMGSLTKSLNQAKKQVEKALGQVDVGAGDSGGGGGKKGGGGKAGGGGIANALGGIMKMLGGISIAVMVVAAISKVFEPVVKIIKLIFRVLAEFLRPIADIAIILLMPILMILKPILKAFQTLMAPVRAAAFAAMKEGGRAMAAGDMSGALKMFGVAAATMIGGLLTIVMSMALQNTITMMGEIAKLLLKGVLEIFRPILEWFKVDVDAAKMSVDVTIDNLVTGANEKISEVRDKMLTAITDFAEKETEAQKLINDAYDESQAKLEETIDGNITYLDGTIGTEVANIENLVTDGTGTIWDGTEQCLLNISQSIEEEKKTWLDYVGDFFKGIGNFLSNLNPFSKKNREEGEKYAPKQFDTSNPFGKEENMSRMNDFLIPPGGKPIGIAPGDTIFGMRGGNSPAAGGGGGGGGGGSSPNITVNITSPLSNPSEMRNIANQIAQATDQATRRRVSY